MFSGNLLSGLMLSFRKCGIKHNVVCGFKIVISSCNRFAFSTIYHKYSRTILGCCEKTLLSENMPHNPTCIFPSSIIWTLLLTLHVIITQHLTNVLQNKELLITTIHSCLRMRGQIYLAFGFLEYILNNRIWLRVQFGEN